MVWGTASSIAAWIESYYPAERGLFLETCRMGKFYCSDILNIGVVKSDPILYWVPIFLSPLEIFY